MPFTPKIAQLIVSRYVCARCYSSLELAPWDITANDWEICVACAGDTYGQSCGNVEDVGRITQYYAIREGQKRADQHTVISQRQKAMSGDAELLSMLSDRIRRKQEYKSMTTDEKIKTLGFQKGQ